MYQLYKYMHEKGITSGTNSLLSNLVFLYISQFLAALKNLVGIDTTHLIILFCATFSEIITSVEKLTNCCSVQRLKEQKFQ